ncbi:MAG: hypothetical protein CVV24_06665 [Ignavibacteriae bacterium HGW-Ignavibacteriae-3]|nr:MAG: hypothetical protein CVV24_06665 [Ignavibacteriae bacterium HGW-Ignavibacteriae-3]
MIKNILFILLLAGLSTSLAQEVTYDKVKKLFENFEYDEMIKKSDQLIERGNLSDSLLIELHMMRANIFYSKSEDQFTRKSFESILKIRKIYSPDPSVTSPKLIAIFNEVKADFLRRFPDVVQPLDSTMHKPEIKYQKQFPEVSAVVKNLFVPGLGQIHHGNNTKGWLTAVASVLSIGGVVYLTIDTNNKQNDYLKETNRALMQQKYDDYSKSYKLRNSAIITFAAIWIYSQIDLIFFSKNPSSDERIPVNGLINLNSRGDNLQLSFNIPF